MMPLHPAGRWALAALLLLAASACATRAGGTVPVYSYEVVDTYPHDPRAFTQGLLFKDGHLYESTGQYGQSTVRKVALESGEVLRQVDLPADVFGEGLVDWDSRLIALTWTSGIGFVFDAEDFSLRSTFRYPGEGWGLTRSDSRLYMSDGTAQLRVLDPETLAETGRVDVTVDGVPLTRLNELEWVDGAILANVWFSDRIARIDPGTGVVTAWIDLRGLLARHGDYTRGTDVLNGIAYDAETGRLFVTGKLWPNLFEIRLLPPGR